MKQKTTKFTFNHRYSFISIYYSTRQRRSKQYKIKYKLSIVDILNISADIITTANAKHHIHTHPISTPSTVYIYIYIYYNNKYVHLRIDTRTRQTSFEEQSTKFLKLKHNRSSGSLNLIECQIYSNYHLCHSVTYKINKTKYIHNRLLS